MIAKVNIAKECYGRTYVQVFNFYVAFKLGTEYCNYLALHFCKERLND